MILLNMVSTLETLGWEGNEYASERGKDMTGKKEGREEGKKMGE